MVRCPGGWAEDGSGATTHWVDKMTFRGWTAQTDPCAAGTWTTGRLPYPACRVRSSAQETLTSSSHGQSQLGPLTSARRPSLDPGGGNTSNATELPIPQTNPTNR